MNKYIEMLDDILNHADKDDFSVDPISVSNLSDKIEDTMKDTMKDVDNIETIFALSISDTYEISDISYIDSNEEYREKDVRQLILNSLTVEETELYHSKCKAVIKKAKEAFIECQKEAEGRYKDKMLADYNINLW